MPVTSLAEDKTALVRIKKDFGQKQTFRGPPGRLNFAGNYWPPEDKSRSARYEATHAVTEARAAILKAYMVATRGARGADEAAMEFMKTWFGPFSAKNEWWVGARCILGALEAFLMKEVNLYYRGDDS